MASLFTTTDQFKTTLLSKSASSGTHPVFVNYDDDFDALMILVVPPETETVVHYLDEHIGLLYQPETLEIVGLQVESFEHNFVPAHAPVQKAWRLSEAVGRNVKDAGDLILMVERIKPRIAREVIKAAGDVPQELASALVNRSHNTPKYGSSPKKRKASLLTRGPMDMKTAGAFISYAHADVKAATDRIAFALKLHTNVFTDAEIQPGPFPSELRKEIEARKFFLAVMSEFSLREDGWCRIELNHARKTDRVIIPIKISDIQDPELDNLTYADFRGDFERGFRRLTQLMFQTPVSSWEHLGESDIDPNSILSELRQGHIPGLIAKEIAEWSLANRLWPYLMQRLSYSHEILPEARTPIGMRDSLVDFRKQRSERPEDIGLNVILNVEELVNDHIQRFDGVPEVDHRFAGENAASTIDAIILLINKESSRRMEEQETARRMVTYSTDVAEKLKELILVHARHSRYLY